MRACSTDAVAAVAVAAPAATTSAAARTLADYLEPIAAHTRRVGFLRFKQVSRFTGARLSEADIRQHSMVAAFHAFVDLGGNVDAPETFPWDAQRDALQRRALLQLRRELVGRDTECGDALLRATPRRDAACNAGPRWDAWTHMTTGEFVSARASSTSRVATSRAGTGTPNEAQGFAYYTGNEQERQLRDEQVTAFADALRDVIDPETYQLMVERFRDGVSQHEQIARFLAAHPEYAGPQGRKRAEDLISQRIRRGRLRAMERLGSAWAELAAEIAA